MAWFTPLLVLLIILVPTILSIQHKALNSPVLFFILFLGFIAWEMNK